MSFLRNFSKQRKNKSKNGSQSKASNENILSATVGEVESAVTTATSNTEGIGPLLDSHSSVQNVCYEKNPPVYLGTPQLRDRFFQNMSLSYITFRAFIGWQWSQTAATATDQVEMNRCDVHLLPNEFYYPYYCTDQIWTSKIAHETSLVCKLDRNNQVQKEETREHLIDEMTSEFIIKLQKDFVLAVSNMKPLRKISAHLENYTAGKLKGDQVLILLIVLTALLPVFTNFPGVLRLAIAFGYPAYRSAQAMKSAKIEIVKEWLSYWIILSLFQGSIHE